LVKIRKSRGRERGEAIQREGRPGWEREELVEQQEGGRGDDDVQEGSLPS
jgi:hypothetical protein